MDIIEASGTGVAVQPQAVCGQGLEGAHEKG